MERMDSGISISKYPSIFRVSDPETPSLDVVGASGPLHVIL